MLALVLLLLGAACAQHPSASFDVRAMTFPSPSEVAVPGGPAARPSSGGLIGQPGSGAPVPGTIAGAGSHSTITLGTVLPLQGGQRNWGEPVLRTTQAFIDETNAVGGINGHPLKLIAYNACLTCQEDALQAVRRLVEQDHVFAIVNTYVEVVAFQSVIDYLANAGVPLIQGAAESQTSAALSPVNFVTAPSGLFWARELPQMIRRFTNATKIGLTYVDVATERNGLRYLLPELQRAGIQLVDPPEKVAAEEDAVTNMDSIVTRMRARGAQAVLSTNPVLLVYGRLAASRQNWNVKWVGLAAWSKLVTDACGHTCDDSLITETAGLSFITRNTPQMNQYRAVLARRYPGGEITGLTLGAWVGMQLTSYVLAQTGPDRPAFLRAMESIHNLDLGTTAPLTFGPDRHMGATADMIIGLQNGRYVPIAGPVDYGEASP